MLEITLLGTGSPIPDPDRAGPSTLVRAGAQAFLVDCGRGVLQRAAAVGVGAAGLSAVLLTHLHSFTQRPYRRARRRAYHQLGHQLRC